MMNQYLKELEQEPFDPDEFVERMVRRTMKESGQGDHFDPEMIHDIFTQAIQDLKVLQERQERKCGRLEQAVQEEEKIYSAKLTDIMEQHTHCVGIFSELDERMSRAGGRALAVGERLGAARAPRARAAAARDLLSHLAHFLSPGPVLTDLFNDPTKLDEAADVIQKLHAISQELPADKFRAARNKIEAKYDEIERSLIDEFVRAQNNANVERMKQIAGIMTNFKGYSQCVDAFIETSQMNTLAGKDIFSAVLPLCKKNYSIISHVFPNPEQVMSKFVLNIFHLKLQKYIQTKLADKNDVDKYLRNLYDMYTSTERVCDELVAAGLVAAAAGATSAAGGALRRDALVNGALGDGADGYAQLEQRRLKAALAAALQRYYGERQHVKRQIQSGGFQELRRDLQAVIGTRANINIAQIENYGGETFLSEELAARVLQDSRASFLRCRTLSSGSEVASTATALLETLVQQLLVEHCDYAVELGLQSIPIAESKVQPQIYFYDIVKQTNVIVHMFEDHFQEYVLPCVTGSPRQAECLQKKSLVLEALESKLEAGLERALAAGVGWVRLHLQAEHKCGYVVVSCYGRSGSPRQAECLQKKSLVLEALESKLEAGLERALAAGVGWVRLHLQAEHKCGYVVVSCYGRSGSPRQAECLQKKSLVLEALKSKLEAGLERALAAGVGWVRLHLQAEHKCGYVVVSCYGRSGSPRQAECLQKKSLVLEALESKLEAGLERALAAGVGWVRLHLQAEHKCGYVVVSCYGRSGSPRQAECLQKKSLVLEALESKLEAGLERALAAGVGWVRLHLQTEHKCGYVVVSCYGRSGSPRQAECLQKKSLVLEALESKLEAGLERALAAGVGWVRLHLQTEQKKTDFKPEGDVDTVPSAACLTVVSYVTATLERVHATLDGGNLRAVTLELAVRLHRVIYDHLQSFQFNSAGAMCAICDVKEYRAAACGRGGGGAAGRAAGGGAPPPAHALFDALHALCNLLLVKPENLQQVCEGETLAELDRSILLNFIQLRTDYKSQKLANCLKGLA